MNARTNTRMRGGAMPGVWVLRVVLVGALMGSLLAGVPEDYTPPWALVVVVAALSVASAFRP